MKSSGLEHVILDFFAAEPEQADERHRAHHFNERRRNSLDQDVAEIGAAAAGRPPRESGVLSYFSAPNAFTT